MKTTEFWWVDDGRGDRIEDFILTLCGAVPDVAKEILKTGFGNLSRWFNDYSTWKNAACGCLIGQAAIIGRDTVAGCVTLIETHPDEIPNDEYAAAVVLYLAISAATKRNIHEHGKFSNDPLYEQISDVGCIVGAECFSRRQRIEEVGQYLLDYIRHILTDMGYTNLPKSPEKACNY